MHNSFNDIILLHFLVVMSYVLILLIKEYRGNIVRPSCDVIDDIITMKNTFSGKIWDGLFIYEVKLKMCLIFKHFENGSHFEVARNFFNASDTGSWICQLDNH